MRKTKTILSKIYLLLTITYRFQLLSLDRASSQSVSRHKRYAKTGESWESQPNIVFSVENSPPDLSNRETCNEIRAALRVWEGVQVSSTHRFRVERLKSPGWHEICRFSLQVRPKEVMSKGKSTGDFSEVPDPKITIMFTYVDGPGRTLAHYYPASNQVYGKQIHFDRAEQWVTKNTYVPRTRYEKKRKLFSVAAHEIGHVLGLDHSKTKNAVMYAVYRNMNENELKVSEDDHRGLMSIYGSSNKIVCAPNHFRSVVVSPETGHFWMLVDEQIVVYNNNISNTFNLPEFTHDPEIKADAIFYTNNNKLGLITSKHSDSYKIIWTIDISNIDSPALERPRRLVIPQTKRRKPVHITQALTSRKNPDHIYLFNHHKVPKVYKYNIVTNKFLNFRKNRKSNVLTQRTRATSILAKFAGKKSSGAKRALQQTGSFNSVFFDANSRLVILSEESKRKSRFQSLKLTIASPEDFQEKELKC